MEGVPKKRNTPPKEDLGPKKFEIQSDRFVSEQLNAVQSGVATARNRYIPKVEQGGNPEMQVNRNETWPENATAEAYEAYEEPLEVQMYNERKQEYQDAIAQWDEYIHQATAEDGHELNEEELHHAIGLRERIKQEMIGVSANYPGDWTGLLYKRLTDPATKEKFVRRRTEAMAHMADDPDKVGRREMPKLYYQDQIENYDSNIARVFSRTEVGLAEDFGSKGRNLGNMGNEGVGAVFNNAKHRGNPLTDRQKNIIEAHEKGHCLRDFVSSYDRQEIQSTIDRNVISELNALRQANGYERIAPTYVNNPMEIAERMAQFKNYFGMGANEKFTKQHLDHVRKSYVADTGLDNGVSDLLYVVTPETEKAFLDVINKYPI